MTYAENDCKENATYFTVGEEKTDTFNAHLKKSTFSGPQILNWEFAAELHSRQSAGASSGGSFHRFFDAVVQRLALVSDVTKVLIRIVKFCGWKNFYLFGVVFVQLRLPAITTPQAENFSFGAVGHVNDPLEPPTLHDGAANRPQNQTVVSDLQEAQITRCVRPYLDGETVPVHLAGSEWFQIDVISSLNFAK